MLDKKVKTKFFYSRKDKHFIQELSQKYWVHEVEEVLLRAILACSNTFIFTHRWDMERCEEPIAFQDEIDWTYRHNDDFEWTVNLNRSRFMAELGQAYWLTDDEKFASAYIRLMNDWIKQNPLTEEEIDQSEDRAYNVKDTWRKLDSGIRICNWIKGYFCIRHSPLWGEEEERQFIDAASLHGLYLSKAYTPHDKQSNWGFLETNGLFQIALLFPQIKHSEQWLHLALERLEVMCELQVFDDGMHNEQSPMYHHEVLHCLFEPVLLAKINQVHVPKVLEQTLNQMFSASLAFSKPSGWQPMISDSDHTDIRDVLTRGAVLFQRGELKHQGYSILDYEGIWYFGQYGFKSYQELNSIEPSFCSTHMEQAGYSIMRSDWSKEGQYLLFDGGHMDIIRAHGHDDFLHFDLSAYGADLLVDTGRCTYMENEERRYFKESFQHNTTSVDGYTISLYKDSWNWGEIAHPVHSYWNSDKDVDYVQAGHTGYWRLEDPVQVLRQILFVKPHYWIVVDTFRSHEEHHFHQHFHFDEHMTLEMDASESMVRALGSHGVNLNIISMDPLEMEQKECWISRDYNKKDPSKKLLTKRKGKGLTKFVTMLVPYREGEDPDLSIEKVDVYNTRSAKLSDSEVTALNVVRGKDSEVILFSHQGPASYQFSGSQMTGDVLFIERRGDKEKKHVVKV